MIKKLNAKKTKIAILSANIIHCHLENIMNHDPDKSFSEDAKIAIACPIYKKSDANIENYRPQINLS